MRTINRVVVVVISTLLALGLGLAPASAAPATRVSLAAVSSCTMSQRIVITTSDGAQEFHIGESGELANGPGRDACMSKSAGMATTAAVIVTGTKYFSRASTTYSYEDANGFFTGQYTVGSSRNVVAFRYDVSKALKDIATGPASAKVSRLPDINCTYNKVQPLNYNFHWSCGSPWNQKQAMRGTWTFPIMLKGKKGTATINWLFQYRVGDPTCVGTCPV